MSLINDALKRASKTIEERGPQPGADIRLQTVDSSGSPNLAAMLGVPIALVVLFSVGGFFLWTQLHHPTPPQGMSSQPLAAAPNQAVAKPGNPGVKPPETPVAKPVVGPNSQASKPSPPPPGPDVASAVPALPAAVVHPTPPAERAKPPAATVPASHPSLIPAKASPPAPAVASAVNATPIATNPPSTPAVGAAPAVAAAEAAPITWPPLKIQGIFFRPGRATAIVNGLLVGPGASVDGASVVAVHRDEVVFDYQGSTKTVRAKP